MSSLILIIPLLNAISSGFLGRKLGIKGTSYLSCFNIIITTLIGLKLFKDQIIEEKVIEIKLFEWITCEGLQVNWSFNFDSLTITMLLPVLIISCLVHIYSLGYMSGDPHIQRFYAYLSLFTFAMLILCSSDNLLCMFLGWEGVGVASYLLVNYWFTRIQANKSAMSALLTNRVGDMILTIGLFIIIYKQGNLDYSVMFSISKYLSETEVTIIALALMIGAMAKSAQLGLHSWLPMAMEGPTNVSSLIHAATMVTAGVFLLIKTSPLLEYSPTVLIIILWIGAITGIFAALIGLYQNDIKKIIAYSTCSQLGMLFVAIGLSSYNLALFHLCNHAFFKALLFLSAGSIIHSINDEQSLRKMGGFINYLPFSYVMILIGSLSLMALPFMTGYYSKDLIIESSYGAYNLSSYIIYYITLISAMFTSLYSLKLIYLTFLSKPNSSYEKYLHIHEPSLNMGIPLIILAIFSIFFGYLFKDLIIGLGSPYLGNSIFILPKNSIMIQTEFSLPSIFKLLPLIFTLLMIIISITVYEFMPLNIFKINSKLFIEKYKFFNQRFYFEFLLEKYIINKGLYLGYISNKDLDRGILEK